MAEQDRFGVYRATVIDNKDPEGRGRVQVKIPSVDPGSTAWAELASLTAGDGYGTWFRPEPGDDVLVAFEEGDRRRPYVVGALWGAGERTPPTTADTAKTINALRRDDHDRRRGVVRRDTLFANSVVASRYSPGVGNVM
jgi:uncharacterized protein involved in type VI secretion and phage assembly